MLYSNWDTSVWFCYWVNNDIGKNFKRPTEELKDSQVFEICDVPSCNVTYGEVKKLGLDIVVNEIKELYSRDYDGSGLIWNPNTCKSEYQESIYPAKNPTNDDIEELKNHLIQFINDVEESFKFSFFIKKYWIKPFIKKIF